MENELNEIFASISPTLLKFAEKHNLRADKYWHNFPSWRFSFKHPSGGLASIEVMAESNDFLKIYGYWWIDDFDSGSRYSKRYESELIQPNNIFPMLENVFILVVNWDINSWSETTHGFKESWSKTFSKDQFLKLNDKYPTPLL